MGMTIDGPGLAEEPEHPGAAAGRQQGAGVKALFLKALRPHEARSRHRVDSASDRLGLPAAHTLSWPALAGTFVSQGERRLTWRDRIDDLLLHPCLGICRHGGDPVLVSSRPSTASAALIEAADWLLSIGWTRNWAFWLADQTHVGANCCSACCRASPAGWRSCCPTWSRSCSGLGLLEDIGYLPRIAFLMDGLMHRLGLHGKAIVPFILGYGCNVPAVMSTRILEERTDRFLAAALAVLVPCCGAAGGRLSGWWPSTSDRCGRWSIYLFNIFVIALIGRVAHPPAAGGFARADPGDAGLPRADRCGPSSTSLVPGARVPRGSLAAVDRRRAVLALLTFFNISPALNWSCARSPGCLGCPPRRACR